MKKNKSKVFISYSHADKEFARQLDTSFFASNIDTFLDERDIQVGESIPEKIYTGIDESSHLVSIISKDSIQSLWVQEELSIAKVKEKQHKGFRILPLLIDEIDVPTGLAHIRYADFKNWKNPYNYRNAFLLLLEAIGIKPRLLGREELVWYAEFNAEIQEHYDYYLQLSAKMLGFLETLFESAALSGALVARGIIDREADLIHINPPFLEKALYREELIVRLNFFYTNLLKETDENSDNDLASLKRKIKETIESSQYVYTENRRINYSNFEKFETLLIQVVNILNRIKTEVEIAVLASAKFS